MRCAIPALAAALFALSLPAQDNSDTEALREQAQEAAQEENWADAAVAYRKITELDAKDSSAWHMLGFSLHAAGKLDEALKAHLKAAEFPDVAGVATYNAACVYSLKGDKDKAFEWLKKAAAAGFNRPEHLDSDTDMDNVRKDPRFAEIIAAMKAAKPSGNQLQVFASNTPRQSTRVLLWAGDRSAGQVVIDYGLPRWKDSYSKMLDKPEAVGRRWRFGKDFWTTYDSNLDLEIGGVKIPAGAYYLTVEHKGDHKFAIAFHDQAAIRKQRLDAFQAEQTRGGIEVPLSYTEASQPAEELLIKLKVTDQKQRKGALVVRFGPHELTAEAVLALPAGKAELK